MCIAIYAQQVAMQRCGFASQPKSCKVQLRVSFSVDPV